MSVVEWISTGIILYLFNAHVAIVGVSLYSYHQLYINIKYIMYMTRNRSTRYRIIYTYTKFEIRNIIIISSLFIDTILKLNYYYLY